jgi:hypothetical protein
MKRLSIFVLMLSSAIVNAQYSDDNTSENPKSSPKELFELRPRLGLGIGTFTFYGDAGGDMKGYSPFSSDLAYSISLTNELNDYLHLRLESVFGTMSINEYNTDRMYNFQSQIRAGSASLSYNFAQFLKPDRFVEPWVSVGIGSFEFLSKTDMYDADGNLYHHWNDGTIRNIAENAANAEDAVMLRRDYIYETDLREMDADGLGKYQERSWSVPVGAGVNFHLSDRFKGRLGAVMNYTFTDNIDNLSDVSAGERKGDSKNDKFLFASLSLSYDLGITPPAKDFLPIEILDDEGNPMLVNWDDWDRDGVDDIADKCPGTPEGASVDAQGCPVDSDGDGFRDYLDAEPASLAGAITDMFGVAMSDDQVEKRYLAWTDSIPWSAYAGVTNFKEDYNKKNSDPSRAIFDPNYTVAVAANDRGLTQSEINAILSLEDVRNAVRGEEDVYLVGQFENLPDAVARKIELNQQGIEGLVRYDDGDKLSNVTAKAYPIEKAMLEAGTGATASNDMVYRVQLGAFRYSLSENIFGDIPEMIALKGDDGLTRYMTGTFTDLNEAAKHKTAMLLEGFDGAFITAYQGGTRVKLGDAGFTLSPDAEDITYDKPTENVDKSLVYFRVQLGSFSQEIPTEALDKYLALGKVRPMRGADGQIKYLHGEFKTMEEATKAMENARSKGMNDAFIIGDFNGKLIPSDDAQKLLGGENDQVYNSGN